jgi:hypothetical protein
MNAIGVDRRLDDKSQLKTESVAAILKRCRTSLIADWLKRTKESTELNHLALTDIERTGHLPKLVEDLIVRLNKSDRACEGDHAIASPAAVNHGILRHTQGYSAAMLVHESRILQVTIFGKLHDNTNALDSSLLLSNVMVIADEVDAQLAQTMVSFMKSADAV